MKYTPGSWTVGKLRLNNGGIPIVGDDRIAVVDKANGEANACLIAAAPDLLEACREALAGLAAHAIGATDTVTKENAERNVREVRRIHGQLRAAIQKAEGQ